MILSSRFAPITLTNADPTGIQLDEVFLRLPSGATDVVWDGAEFRGPYAVSDRTGADPSYTLTLRRSGGWPSSFVLVARVIDVDGNQALNEYPFTVGATPPPPQAAPGGTGEALRIGSAIAQVLDHAAQTQNSLIHYFKGQPRMRAILEAWAAQVQDLETVFWDLLTKRGISTAVGVQLDALGELVGEPRQDRTDAEYRAAVRVRIMVNDSDGRVEDLIEIVQTMLGLEVGSGEIQVTESYPAHLTFRLLTTAAPARAKDVARALRQAKPAAVSMDVAIVSDPARTFTWGHATGSGPATPGGAPDTGWGTVNDPSTGGLWAGLL